MGYRHKFMTCAWVPREDDLPEWFIEKYGCSITYLPHHWVSTMEYKRYDWFSDLEVDIQKVLIQMHPHQDDNVDVRVVFFADESDANDPDISMVVITKDNIMEYEPYDGWCVTEINGVPQPHKPKVEKEFWQSKAEMPEGSW
jgi:hypothetical protein